MKNEILNRWGDIHWGNAARHVFKLHARVLDADIRGERHTVSLLQEKIADSFHAKALAVRQVAQLSSGRNTAGPDGVKSLNAEEKMRMAAGLTIHHQPSAVRRKWIPKPGKDEMRGLGIPNMIDRAHQALLALTLEAQWEARFSGRQYGFRRGRGPHDAINFIQRHLRQSGPKWILEIDIEKFFDRIDHGELLRRLDAPPTIAEAVRKTLKAGVLDSLDHSETHMGAPQGGPLSPLLANIALAGLEDHLEHEFRKEYAGRITAIGRPTLVIYADDAIVAHRDRNVVEWSQTAIQAYLDPLGLNLNATKTKISHTQQPTQLGEDAGFDFLGFHVQHVWTKKTGGMRAPYLLVTPSNRSMMRFYRECAERINELKLSRKLRGARRDRQACGMADPVTNMIRDLNRKISGWGNYFCKSNAKEAFGRMDHLIHSKLWQWTSRRFKGRTVQWRIDNLFSGVGRDRKGEPLLRNDGTPRECKWTFKSPFARKEEPHLTLCKLAHIKIQRHVLVQPNKRYHEDWPYWQKRMQTRYPGTPPMAPIAAFRRQQGRCARCNKTIRNGERLTIRSTQGRQVVSHSNCSTPPSVIGVQIAVQV